MAKGVIINNCLTMGTTQSLALVW